MAHEAIVNALKHGHPSRVTVDVELRAHDVFMVIADDGRGFAFSGRFDHDTLVQRNVGPASLRDRTAALGGTIAIQSGRTGARVELTVPV
jgi:signal transduction histidine kinase